MKKLLLISFAFALSLSTQTPAAAIASGDDDCENGSHFENAECVGLKLNIADQELTATVSAIHTRLTAAAKTDRSAAEVDRRLLKSQQAWSGFRTADCSLEGAEMIGGNGEGIRIQRCELSKTQERILRLQESSF